MSIVSEALDTAGDARFDREVQMDQRKPAAPASVPGMSRSAATEPGRDEAAARVPESAPAPAVDQLISRQLRAIYDEVVNEPVPDGVTLDVPTR